MIIDIKIELISFIFAPIAKNPIRAINTVNSTNSINLFKIDILKLKFARDRLDGLIKQITNGMKHKPIPTTVIERKYVYGMNLNSETQNTAISKANIAITINHVSLFIMLD